LQLSLIRYNAKKVCFSVIIPVLDQSAYSLPFTLDGIYGHSHTPSQVILIDGTKGGLNFGFKENT